MKIELTDIKTKKIIFYRSYVSLTNVFFSVGVKTHCLFRHDILNTLMFVERIF